MKYLTTILSCCIAVAATADERILNYHSEILIKSNGWIEVTETIQVRAEGQQIRRGIYRDYPTDYEDRYGNAVQVVYEPRSVLRNDQREDFFSERRSNGVRTYFGSADRMLDHGIHTYSYRYDANRMLGFFETHDELYWNVTGNGWDFPIDSATATVSFDFPMREDDLNLEAFTGRYGGAASNYRAWTTATGDANFEATVELGPRAGLSIVVAWPKGMIDEPSEAQKIAWLMSDNLNLLVAFGGLLAMLAYYVPVWLKFGKDPEPGTIMPRYAPPKGFSPASLRYIENMVYDATTLTSAIVSLAVKKRLKISKFDDYHTLTLRDADDADGVLAAGEKELLETLFSDQKNVNIGGEYEPLLREARSAHRESLKRDYKHRYFQTNGLLNLPPILVGIVAAVVSVTLASGITPFVVAAIVAMLITTIGFAILLKRPTGLGRKVMDETAGFREYLEIAEKDEMNLRNPPDKTPELFERFLPFAMAMGVEQEWADRFTEVFERLKESGASGYQPNWYNGSWNSIDFGSSMSGLSSDLGSAIATSSSPPGSSSGSGGGGFSGGGGGGGGGGGW